MAFKTIETKADIVVGGSYFTRGGDKITIVQIEPFGTGGYYCQAWFNLENGYMKNYAFQENGHVERGQTHPFDILKGAEVNFKDVEDISSMFKFMSTREKELGICI